MSNEGPQHGVGLELSAGSYGSLADMTGSQRMILEGETKSVRDLKEEYSFEFNAGVFVEEFLIHLFFPSEPDVLHKLLNFDLVRFCVLKLDELASLQLLLSLEHTQLLL